MKHLNYNHILSTSTSILPRWSNYELHFRHIVGRWVPTNRTTPYPPNCWKRSGDKIIIQNILFGTRKSWEFCIFMSLYCISFTFSFFLFNDIKYLFVLYRISEKNRKMLGERQKKDTLRKEIVGEEKSWNLFRYPILFIVKGKTQSSIHWSESAETEDWGLRDLWGLENTLNWVDVKICNEFGM